MFKKGDIVRCINESVVLIRGNLYTVNGTRGDFVFLNEAGSERGYHPSRFELVAKAEHVQLTKNEVEYKKIERHYVNLHDIREFLRGDHLALVSDSLYYAISLVQKELDTLKSK